MSDIFSSPFFGIALSILTFWSGVKLQKRLKSVLCNPLLIAILLTSVVLLAFDIPYESYNEGGAVINMFLTPATACLAVSIYTKIQILKKNCIPIVVGCTVGSLASMGSVWLLCQLFGLDEAMTASLIPKSITTPIAMEVCQSHGGIVPVTVIAVIFTGILGSILAPFLIGHRSLQPRGGNLPGAGAGRDGGSHERSCHRRLRNHYGACFHDSAVRTVWSVVFICSIGYRRYFVD